MLHAIGARDFPVLGGAIVMIGVVVSLSSLAVDVMAMVADPRQRSMAL